MYPTHANHMGMLSLANTSFLLRSSIGTGFWLSETAVPETLDFYRQIEDSPITPYRKFLYG